MLRIYHNPRCRKNRAGLAYLQEKGLNFKIREYLKEPFTEKELTVVIQKWGKKPFDLVRQQEEIYKKEFKGLELSDREWIKIMIQNPKLIERPMVVSDDKAILGQPPEVIGEIL